MKALIVEDSLAMRFIISGYLKWYGIKKILFAENGEKAKKILTSEQGIELVICDWILPKVNGKELLADFRKKEENKKKIFIMVTTEPSQEFYESAKKIGVNAILRKPFTKQMFTDTLKECLDSDETCSDNSKILKRNIHKSSSGFERISFDDKNFMNILVKGIITNISKITKKPLEEIFFIDVKREILSLYEEIHANPDRINEIKHWKIIEKTVLEVKEFVFHMESPATLRKNRRPQKSNFTKNYTYLIDVLKIFIYMFEMHFSTIVTLHPELLPFEIEMKELEQWIINREVLIVPAELEKIYTKYENTIEREVTEMQKRYDLLGRKVHKKTPFVNLFLLSVCGIDALPSEIQLLPNSQDNIEIDNLGILEKKDEIFKNEFAEFFANKNEKRKGYNERLLDYIASVNQFCCLANRTERFLGTKELFAALHFFLNKMNIITPSEHLNNLQSLKKVFSVYSDHLTFYRK